MEGLRQHKPKETQCPDLSLIIPCYNEEDSVRNTVVRLAQAFRAHDIDVELVLVDNGSNDQTAVVIDQLIQEGLPVVKAVVEHNEGYGNGILQGLPVCRGDLIGFMCADEQVEAVDAVKLCQIARNSRSPKLFKVRRRFRLDGPLRRVISALYNLIANALFGELGTMDINANPKLISRHYIELMNLESKDWFLDAEVLIKAKLLGLPVFEMNVFSHMRAEGRSNVRPVTCMEFLVNLLKYRLSGHYKFRQTGEVPMHKTGTALPGK
jgi:glycosyltransferase involved in cell wall biosynthesis